MAESKAAHTIRYKPFEPLENVGQEGNPSRVSLVSKINRLISDGRSSEAREETAELIKVTLQGLQYLETYAFRTLLKTATESMQIRSFAHSGHCHCSLSGMGCLFIAMDLTPCYFPSISQSTCCGQNCGRRNANNILDPLRSTKSSADILCLRNFPLLFLAALRAAWSSYSCAAIQVRR
jgi:hypothetical protein